MTENCPVPVLIAGGPKMDTVEETLQVVHDATRAGAAGVVFGRNIWQSGDTRGTIQTLRRIIHERPTRHVGAGSRTARNTNRPYNQARYNSALCQRP